MSKPTSELPSLSVLLADYQATRDDDREGLAYFGTVFTITVGLLTLFFAVVLNSVPYSTAPDATRLNPVLAFVLPIGPLAVATYLIRIDVSTVLRGYYVRSLEREIRRVVDVPLELGPGVFSPSIGHLWSLLNAASRGPARIRFLTAIASGAIVLIFGVGALMTAWTISDLYWRTLCILLYATLAVSLSWVFWTATVRPRAFFRTLYRRLPDWSEESLTADYTGYRISSNPRYWIWPRIPEVTKAINTVATFLLAWWVLGDLRTHLLLPGLIFLVAFEAVAYQARYIWNDLRGLQQDSAHPAAEGRGRMPIVQDVRTTVRLATTSILARLALAAILIGFLSPANRIAAGSFILAIAILAVVYEVLRDMTETKRTQRRQPARLGLRETLLYFVVAQGYGVRALAGAWFGSGGRIGLGLLASSLYVTVAALNLTGCLRVWVFESGRVENNGYPVERSHVACLLPWYRRARARQEANLAKDSGGHIKHYESKRGERMFLQRDLLRSPWGISQSIAFLVSGVVGAELCRMKGVSLDVGPAGSAVVCLIVGASLFFLSVAWGMVSLLAAVVVAALVIDQSALGVVLLLIAFLVTGISYLITRRMTYEELVEGFKPIADAIAQGAKRLIGRLRRLYYGPWTTEALEAEQKASETGTTSGLRS